MPVLACATTGLPDHIYGPIVEQLSHRILESLDFQDVIGDKIYIKTDWTTHSQTSGIERDAILGATAFSVEAMIQQNPTSQKWDAYTFHHTTAYGLGNTLLNNGFPVYKDDVNRVRMIEMVSPVTIALNCELTVNSSEIAYKAPQEIFNAYENGSIIHFQDLAFDYPVPKEFISILYGLWKMDRAGGQPADVSFYDYLQARTDKTWNLRTHRDKDECEVVIPRFDLQALATFEYSEDKPQAQMKDKVPIGFTISFVYTVQFALPTLTVLQFPVVYNNQVVPEQFIPIDKQQRFNALNGTHKGIQNQIYDNTFRPSYARGVICPNYDDWVMPARTMLSNNNLEPIATIHLLVDEDTPTTKIDLKEDLDENISLSPVVKEILYQQGEESVEYSTIFNVALFKEDKLLVPYDDFTFDEDLILSFKPANKNVHYRAIVTAAMNLSKIDPKWWDLLKKYFAYLNPAIKNQIAKAVTVGWWSNPKWRGHHVVIDEYGNIYVDGKLVGTINDYRIPDSAKYHSWQQGDLNAYSKVQRIFNYGIIARNPRKP